MKKYLPMHLFQLNLEILMLNKHKGYKDIEYPDKYTNSEILFEGSKDLPRKKKKLVRNLICLKS